MEAIGVLPPHDLTAEAAVLSACMIDGRVLDVIRAFLAAEHFFSEGHRRIYEAICWSWDRKQPTDVVAVGARLRDQGRLEQVGGMGYLTEILNVVPSLTNTEHYARIVFDHARVRILINCCQRIAADGYTGNKGAQELIDAAEAAIAKVTQMAHNEVIEANLVTLKRIIQSIADAQKRAQEGGEVTGVSGIHTGFKHLDRLTYGLHGKQLTVIAARPGMGKTSIALQKADAVASQGIGVMFFSFEMSREELLQRHLCIRSNVSSDLLRGGGLQRTHWAALMDASTAIAKLPLYIDDTPALDVRHIKARTIKQMEKSKALGSPLGLVIIDYLQWVKAVPEMQNAPMRDQIGTTSKTLKTMAKELCIPVIALAALNRQVEQSGKVRWPKFSDIRDCGNIESDADNIFFIHREAKIDKDREVFEENSDSLLIIAKQRGGAGEGTIKLKFDGPLTKFTERELE